MNTVKKIFIVSTALVSSAFIFAQGKPSAYTDADLVWQEEFNEKKLNTKDWNYEFHEPGWVNEELQSYDDSKENTYLKDGCLVIQALKKENSDGTADYTSGRINTQGKHTFTYGRFEARLKVPKGAGFLPAFWMMPDDEGLYGQWPKCGEIDIMEVLGHETTKLYGTLHFGEPHAMTQGTYDDFEKNFADNFHTFAVEWEPGEIRWYCDGVNYKTANDWFTKKPGFGELSYPAPFDQPFYIILNVAVGGSWVGYPDENTSFDPSTDDAKMYVDYVRVYQKKSYNEDVEKPEAAPVVATTDTTGNMIKPDSSKWEFLTAGGGEGALNVNNGELAITTANEGNLEYSVQVVQSNVALNNGFKYKYSFDAYADEPRTIITGITAPNNSYERRFGDVKVKLTKEKQHFEWEFVMTADSDGACRVEYNLGAQKSKATVHVSNIRLEKIGEVATGSGANVLPDGNHLFNGEFQEGKGRLGYWEIENKVNADISVTRDRERMLKVVSPKKAKAEDVVIKQSGIKLEGGNSYKIRMSAASTKSGHITVKFGNQIKKERIVATSVKKLALTQYEWIYVPETDEEISFEILAGTDGGTLFIDNISLKESKVVVNGELDLGMSGWELYSHAASSCQCDIVEENGNKAAAITIDNTGNMDWHIQFKQTGCLLEKGKQYKITLKAKSDMKRTIMLALQRDGSKDDNWDPYSGTLKFDVEPEFKEYTWTFGMAKDTDPNVIFTISLGAVSDKIISNTHTVVLDSICVEEVISEGNKKSRF